MVKRRRYPPMKSQRSEGGSDELEGKYRSLQQSWNSYKQSNRRHHVSRCSTGGLSSTITSVKNTSIRNLLSKSPRELMSSLQVKQRMSPSDENEDMVVNEIVKDRYEAIQTGNKLKGRRLFHDDASSELVGENDEICSDVFDLINEESEVRSWYGSNDGHGGGIVNKEDESSPPPPPPPPSCCSSSLSISEKLVEINVAAEKRNSKGGRVTMPVTAWFAVMLMVVTVAFISMSCNGGYSDEEDVEVFLVPT